MASSVRRRLLQSLSQSYRDSIKCIFAAFWEVLVVLSLSLSLQAITQWVCSFQWLTTSNFSFPLVVMIVFISLCAHSLHPTIFSAAFRPIIKFHFTISTNFHPCYLTHDQISVCLKTPFPSITNVVFSSESHVLCPFIYVVTSFSIGLSFQGKWLSSGRLSV